MSRSSKRAPAAIKMKPVKFDVGALAKAYEWVTVGKTIGLSMAIAWYDENVVRLLAGDPLDADRQKAFDRARKARENGNHAGTPEERTHSWTTALRLYEGKVWPTKNLPKVDEALATPPNGLAKGVAEVLGALNKAFQGFNIRFTPHPGADRVMVRNEINLPQSEIETLIAQPPLKTVLDEAVTVAKAASVVDGENGPELDGDAFLNVNLPKALAGVYEWAAAGAQFKVPVKPTQTKPVGVPRTRSTVLLSAADPLGIFRPDTAKAEIASILADGAPHSRSDLENVCDRRGITRGQVSTAIKDLIKKGYTFERNGSQIRLVR